MQNPTQKIIPHLWLNGTAEQAARSYTALLPDSGIRHVGRYGEAGRALHGQPPGTVMSVEVSVGGYLMVLINGGPAFRPTPALSLMTVFETPDALQQAWERLLEGAKVLMPLDRYDWSPRYGWLEDRDGVSWQLMQGSQAEAGAAITPTLMFTGEVAGRAEEAVQHYTAIFPAAAIDLLLHHPGSGADQADSVLQACFRLAGQPLRAMDSALDHGFGFTEATSLMVVCDSQEEVDHYWQALSAVPEAEACGWLKDRFGLSWQVVPRVLIEGMKSEDPAVVQRITEAFMTMKKLDVVALEQACSG